MIKVYFLPVERIDNTDKVKGSEYIHDAILDCTEKPDVRKLTMDVTPEEDAVLSEVAIEIRNPTPEEITTYGNLQEPSTPGRDLASEIDEIKARLGKLEKK